MPTTTHPDPPTTEHQLRDRRRALVAIAAWVVLVLVARFWAEAIQEGGRVIRLKAPPLVGFDVVRISWRNLASVAVGASLVATLPRLTREWSWPRTLGLTAASSALWTISLAVVDGWAGLTRGVRWKSDEYIFEVAGIDSPADFVAGFTDNISGYVTHVRSHPPGMVLLLWLMDRLGLSGFGWNAALFIGGGVLGIIAVLIAVREVLDEPTARRAAPFMVMAPAAIWIATTTEAFYAGLGVWAVTLIVLATGRRGRSSIGLAVGGGLLFGLLAYMSYGHILLAVIPFVVALRRKRLEVIAIAAIGALPVAIAFTVAGFWWFEGLVGTRTEYAESVARDRRYVPFLIFNAAALAIAVGPASVAALTRVHDRRLWLTVGGALGAVGFAAITGLSKGEVERIWLPFTLWILPVGAMLTTDDEDRVAQGWLGLQGATAIAIQSLLKPRW